VIFDDDPEAIPKLKQELKKTKAALTALYSLKEGLAKPGEHKPTRDALILAEQVLFGHTHLKP
jgi:hypothetical protein